MRIRIIAIWAGLAVLGPLAAAEHPQPRATSKPAMTNDMREAIAFQRHKDQADARQAAIEARHPTVHYGNAEKRAEERQSQDRRIPDPGERQYQRDQR
jgi:hypothetical protein